MTVRIRPFLCGPLQSSTGGTRQQATFQLISTLFFTTFCKPIKKSRSHQRYMSLKEHQEPMVYGFPFLKLNLPVFDQSSSLNKLCNFISQVACKEKPVPWLHFVGKSHESQGVTTQCCKVTDTSDYFKIPVSFWEIIFTPAESFLLAFEFSVCFINLSTLSIQCRKMYNSTHFAIQIVGLQPSTKQACFPSVSHEGTETFLGYYLNYLSQKIKGVLLILMRHGKNYPDNF